MLLEASTDMISSVEVNLGVICACVPALRGLIVRKMPNAILSKIKRSQATGSSASSGANNMDSKTREVVNVNRLARIDEDEEAARCQQDSSRTEGSPDIPLDTFQHLPKS